MDFLNYLRNKELNEDYEPEVFEDEFETQQAARNANAAAREESAGYKNQLEVLLSKYFVKAGDDGLRALDGFGADLRDALSDYLQTKWVKDDFFTGDDNAKQNFQNAIRQLLDVKNLPKLQDFIHSLGQAVQSLKINAR